uniref:Membrane protein BRI3 n=1 Tax=Gallus gallus TaxID=9031 RepID=A0A8V0ZN79_CHICK
RPPSRGGAQGRGRPPPGAAPPSPARRAAASGELAPPPPPSSGAPGRGGGRRPASWAPRRGRRFLLAVAAPLRAQHGQQAAAAGAAARLQPRRAGRGLRLRAEQLRRHPRPAARLPAAPAVPLPGRRGCRRICCSSTDVAAELLEHIHHHSAACCHHFCSSSWRLSCLQPPLKSEVKDSANAVARMGHCSEICTCFMGLVSVGDSCRVLSVRVGVLEDTFTCLGVLCAIVFFPIGILFCLALRQRRCPNCGAAFG